MKWGIEIKEISHRFSDKSVLNQINLQIKEGEIFGLLGPSGAGKTTLIKILTGQLVPSNGEANLFGKNTSVLDGKDYEKIGIMMDNFGLYERLSCYDNLKFYAELCGISVNRIDEVLEYVGLFEVKKTVVMNLSKGMRSRLLLARALMKTPQILFLDEPTSGLDPATTEMIHRLISEVKKGGTTIFLTTHNMMEAEKLCDHIALLNEGNIIEYGTPKEICRRYNHQKKIKLHLYDGTEVELEHNTLAAEALRTYFMEELVETIHSTEPSLETVFIELTGRELE